MFCAAVAVVLLELAAAQTTITLNPTYRSAWQVPEYFSSLGIEYLNHEVRMHCCFLVDAVFC